MENKQDYSNKDHWLETALEFVSTTIARLGKNIAEGVTSKIESIVASVVQRLMMVFVLFVGLIFFLVGIAKLLNDLIASSTAVGYLIVGGGMLLIVLFMGMVKTAFKKK